ncbi:MAG: nucleotidyltransferase domain-containing protein [Anaerolineae bacterium]|nr:nucleotidyltransferase domain-containing protein [Anaerolineae bacterium]
MTNISSSDAQVDLLVRKYKDKIEMLYRPKVVWLFGSRASGAATKHSDIDLIVVSSRFSSVRHLKRRSTFLRETGLANEYDLPVVDPLCYTPEEYSAGLQQPTIVAEAIASGVRLFGQEFVAQTGRIEP